MFRDYIVKPIANLNCSAAACERVNSCYKPLIGLGRVAIKNERAWKLLSIYFNRKTLRALEQLKADSITPRPVPDIPA